MLLLVALACSPKSEDTSALEAELDQARAELAALEERLAALEGAVDEVSADVAAQADAIDAQADAIDAQADAIDAIGPTDTCALADALGRCWSDPSCAGACTTRRVFVTSTTYEGDLDYPADASADRLHLADTRCQVRADAAGLGGRWKAWLAGVVGDPLRDPLLRFSPYDGPFERIDGVQVATSPADLLDGTLLAPIEVDETGATQTGPAWTGVGSDGRAMGLDPLTDTCRQWTYATAWGFYGTFFYEGLQGDVSAIDAAWTEAGSALCNEEARLYCFEQAS